MREDETMEDTAGRRVVRPSHDSDPVAGDGADDDMLSPSPRAFAAGAVATLLVAICCVVGAVFAATSTRDFASHLDGQVHAIACSVIPGEQARLGASGCKTAMMSTYSSFWRDRTWGGVPVALPGLAVFSVLAAMALFLAWLPGRSRRESGWLLLAMTVPLGTSAVFGWIAANELGSFCTVCVGIYAASTAGWLAALTAWLQASPGDGAWPWARMALWTGEGVVAVVVVVAAWMSWAPVDRPSLKGCGALVQQDAPGVLVPLPRAAGATPSLLVLDPLCPACRAFEQRLHQTGLDARLGRDLLLFPLDSACNWMVKTSLHPGACAVSEAIVCAPGTADAMLAFAFAEQERLLALGRSDEAGLRKELATRFPAIASCLGSAEAKARINKSLRFAVANAMVVSTPQLFVASTRLCDEDTDLGMEFVLGRMLAAQGGAGGGASR